MSRIADTALTSYETVSQALISLGRLYYENHHDDPNPEAKGLIDAIDSCLFDTNTVKPQGSIERVVERHTKSEMDAASAFSTSNEPASTNADDNLPPEKNMALRQCPYCDAPLLDNAKFCSICGSSLS